MQNLVNIPRAAAASGPAPPPPPGGGAPAPADGNAVGVFTSSQAVVTFPAASGLITVVWKVLGQVNMAWGTNKLVPLVLALIVGLLIFLQSNTPGGALKDKVIGFIFALLNSVTLAATALGISTAVNP
jgi:hypothetical protein